jgi:outer membrane lipoprotein SlyB
MRRLVPLLIVAALAHVFVPWSVGATRPSVVVVPITVVNGRVTGGTQRPSVKKGQIVKLVIKTDAGTEIHVHGYDIQRTPVKGQPTVIRFLAKIQGRFEVELHTPNVLLAELTVR